MKYLFFSSMIPLLFLNVHALKTFDIYFVTYFFITCIHLTGRPFFIGVQKIFQIQRAFELCLFCPYKTMVVFLFLLGPNVQKSSLYGVFVFMSGRYILSILLTFIICLHEIPINSKSPASYFHVRMIKNFVLFLFIFMDTTLHWSSLGIILLTTAAYLFIRPKDNIDREYLINSAPITYPVPLDIKDAIRHCKTAKILFKKNAV